MGISVDTINLRFNVKPVYDQQQLQQLQEDLKLGQKEIEKTRKAMDKLAKNGLSAMTKEQRDEYDKLSSTLSKQAHTLHENEMKMKEWTRSANINKLSIQQLGQRAKDLTAVLNNLNPQTDEFVEYKAELDAVKERMKELKTTAKDTEESLGKWGGLRSFVGKLNIFGFAITNALAIKDRIVAWADQYVQSFAKMDDAMTDVMKYTGQTKREVEEMNETFAKMTTRTPREELNALAGAAGRLGIQGKKDIEGFVDAADKINVALGDDLGEGAIDQIGKLTMVFGEDKTKGLNGAMLATGSAINVLGANSSANTGFITEFTSSMAGMAVNANISQTDIMGYASALSQAGIEGQTASGVFAQLITKMFTDPAKFARAAKLDVKAFTDLLKTDANAAILQFLEGLKQNGGFDSLAPALKSLKMQGTQAVPVISSLINKMDELKKAQSDAKQAYDEGISIIDEFNNANSSAAAKLEIAKKGLNDVAVELGQKLMPIVEGGMKTSKMVLQLLSAIAGFVTRNIAILSRLAIGVAAYTAAVQVATNATKIWAAVTKATPWGLVIAGLTTVLVAYDKYKTRMAEAKKLREELNQTEADATSKYSDQSREVKRLDAAMRDERVSIDERRNALNRLKAIIPDYNGMLDEEGRLTRDNKKAIDDYLVSLQKQIRLKAYQSKLEELYTRQANQEEEQRTASDKYWNAKQTNTLQGGNNNPSMSLIRWLGIGEESSLKRTLDEADKALADTNSKITTLENRIKDLGGNVITAQEEATSPTPPETITPTPDSGSGSGSSKENSERMKRRKEKEAQAKADYEKDLIMLKQQYQGRKELADEWHQREFLAEERYLEQLGQIQKEYGASQSDQQETANKVLDLIAKRANYEREAEKRRLSEKLQEIDREQADKEVGLMRERLSGEISTEEEYNRRKLEVEIEYQKQRVNRLKEGSAEYLAAEKQLLQLELQQLQAKKKEAEDFTKSYQDTNNRMLHLNFEGESFDRMRELNEEYRAQDLISYAQYQQNLSDIAQAETDKRQAIQQAAVDGVNNLLSSASSLFSAMQQRETAAVDAKYKKLIAAAKKQGKDTTKLEEQQEAEKAAIAKKYADRNFQIQVLQIIGNTAQGISKTIAELGMPWAVPFVAMAAAAGAMQLASAKAAADQAAGLYEGGYSDDYQEGYTKKGDPKKPAGVIPVHRNEFVANHKAVANPEVRPVLDVIDRHQRVGDIQMLNATRMLEEAYGRGRYRGGYSQGGSADGEDGMSPMGGAASLEEVERLLSRIEQNTGRSMTIRKLRDEIAHEEQLERNAQR